MTTKTDSKASRGLVLRKTLADVLAAVERNTALSPTRSRDLRSSVIRVADILDNVPPVSHSMCRRSPPAWPPSARWPPA